MARFSLIDQAEQGKKDEERLSSDEHVKLGLCAKLMVAYMTVVVGELTHR